MLYVICSMRRPKRKECENEQLKCNELLNAMHGLSVQVILRFTNHEWCVRNKNCLKMTGEKKKKLERQVAVLSTEFARWTPHSEFFFLPQNFTLAIFARIFFSLTTLLQIEMAKLMKKKNTFQLKSETNR